MHPIVKMLIGLLLLVGSAYWMFYGIGSKGLIALLSAVSNIPVASLSNRPVADFLVILDGAVPPLLILLGLFIIWLEWDEWKIERELSREEKKSRRKK